MHKELARKKPEPMILSTHFRNVVNISFDIVNPTSSHICWTLYVALPSTLLGSNQLSSNCSNAYRLAPPLFGLSNLFGPDSSPPNNKKTDEKSMDEFL